MVKLLLNTRRETAYGVGGVLLGHPATRSWMWSNVARPIIGGHLRAARNVGGLAVRATGWAALGYGIGAVAGTAISGVAFGKEGARKAIDLYSSPFKVMDEVLRIPTNVKTIATHYLS